MSDRLGVRWTAANIVTGQVCEKLGILGLPEAELVRVETDSDSKNIHVVLPDGEPWTTRRKALVDAGWSNSLLTPETPADKAYNLAGQSWELPGLLWSPDIMSGIRLGRVRKELFPEVYEKPEIDLTQVAYRIPRMERARPGDPGTLSLVEHFVGGPPGILTTGVFDKLRNGGGTYAYKRHGHRIDLTVRANRPDLRWQICSRPFLTTNTDGAKVLTSKRVTCTVDCQVDGQKRSYTFIDRSGMLHSLLIAAFVSHLGMEAAIGMLE